MQIKFLVILIAAQALMVNSFIEDFPELITNDAEHLTEIMNIKLQSLQRNIERNYLRKLSLVS